MAEFWTKLKADWDTISGLQPGGIYILEMLWSTDGGRNYGGDNSVCRFVQLPCNTTETLQMYEGSGRVSAQLEPEDKALASNTNFNTWLERMNSAYNALKELTGYTPYNAQKIIMKSTRENLNEYFNEVDGENYWWVTFGYYDYTRIFKHSKAFNQGLLRRLSQGDWGDTPMHELSHTFDCYSWNFDPETLAQFKLYYVISTLNAKVYRPDRFNNNGNGWYTGTNYYTLLKTDRYLDSYTNSFNQGTYASEGFAAILIEIQQQIGWEPFKKTFRYFSDLSYSQMPDTDGEKLKLFLTKLKDYSGRDVLSYISTRDKNIINNHYNISLGYVAPVIPITSGGTSSVISADSGQYATYEFTPSTSGNYYIYTSPYAGSGISNDTYIEVYTDSSMTNSSLIASNDDYDGGRFSKVNVALTNGTTYYIKVRHYNNGKLLSQIHITKDIPIETLSLDSYKDMNISYGDYTKCRFTPETSGTYVFEVTGYNGGSLDYNTYIKLYENESLTKQIGNDNIKIVANLRAGHTYYLTFSGFLMRRAKGRLNVKQGATIEFKKRTDSSFIYVNSPEYITYLDIIDDVNSAHRKLFEERIHSGKYTYYQTHLVWIRDDGHLRANDNPTQSFYIDIDFYNPTERTISVDVSNLTYNTDYSYIGFYFNGGASTQLTIPPHQHRRLFKSFGDYAEFCCNENPNVWAVKPTIMFDFTVSGGDAIVNSLAAYDFDSFQYINDENRVLSNNLIYVNGNTENLDSGDVIIRYDSNGNPIWNIYSTLRPRQFEEDLYTKYIGIAENQSAWVDAELDFVIDDSTPLNDAFDIKLKDAEYEDGFAGLKKQWLVNVNPIYDMYGGMLYNMPSQLHRFKYHRTDGGIWNFAYDYRNLKHINSSAQGNESINDRVAQDVINSVKSQAATGVLTNYGTPPDSDAMPMGGWGSITHYVIHVYNTTDKARTVKYMAKKFDNVFFGSKKQNQSSYQLDFLTNKTDNWTEIKSVSVPPNSNVTFEIVELPICGDSGIYNSIFVN